MLHDEAEMLLPHGPSRLSGGASHEGVSLAAAARAAAAAHESSLLGQALLATTDARYAPLSQQPASHRTSAHFEQQALRIEPDSRAQRRATSVRINNGQHVALARGALINAFTLFFDVIAAELLYSQGSILACIFALGLVVLQFRILYIRTRQYADGLMGGRARKPPFIRAFLRAGSLGILGLEQLLLLDALGLISISDVDLGDLTELPPVYRAARMLGSALFQSLPLLSLHIAFAYAHWRSGGAGNVLLLRQGARGWALRVACSLDLYSIASQAWSVRVAAAALGLRVRAHARDVLMMRDAPPMHALFTHSILRYAPSSSADLDAQAKRRLCVAIGANRSLRFLDLSLSNLGDEELERLAPVVQFNPRLHTLALGRNRISDEGAEILASHLRLSDGLADLRLWDNLIGDLGCTALADALCRNSSLRKLTLYGNRIADDGAAALGAALAVNTSLTSLGLSANLLSDAGAAALAASLGCNNTLIEMNLAYNAIGDDGARAIAHRLGSNQSLTELGLWYAAAWHTTCPRAGLLLPILRAGRACLASVAPPCPWHSTHRRALPTNHEPQAPP